MKRSVFFENRTEQFQVVSGPGFSFAPHLHSHLELLFVQEGKIEVTVRAQTEALCAGSLAIIFPNQIHSYQTMSGEDSRVIMVIADLSYTGGHLDTLLHLHPAVPFLSRKQLHPNALYGLEELTREGAKPVYGPLIQLILGRTLPELRLHQNRSDDYQSLTWQIANFINEHYREPLTLNVVAKAVGISPGRLSHVFSEKMGQGFPFYLAGIRLSYARAMLSDTGLSVSEISEEAGFESQRTFFRAFQRHHNMTPLEYRRQLRRESIEEGE